MSLRKSQAQSQHTVTHTQKQHTHHHTESQFVMFNSCTNNRSLRCSNRITAHTNLLKLKLNIGLESKDDRFKAFEIILSIVLRNRWNRPKRNC